MYFWKKKLGDIHIAGTNETLCGRPMLGNNYATQHEEFATCIECINKDEQINPESYNFNTHKSNKDE